MPIIERGDLVVDVTEAGSGPAVVLVHSSVSGARQWRRLTEELAPAFRVLAVNLLGYGGTTPFSGTHPQTLEDQVEVVLAACELAGGPVSMVGHSFGGSVALATARRRGDGVRRMVLLEPNPFRMLLTEGRTDAYQEANALYSSVKRLGAAGEWQELAAEFADYFSGDGTWAAMPHDRRDAFAASLPPNFHEWDAVMGDTTSAAEWGAAADDVGVVEFGGTRRSLMEIVELLRDANPRWSYTRVETGGHMAPLTRPDLVNPLVAELLRRP